MTSSNPKLNNAEDAIKEAYEAGKDKKENGANEINCNFRHFSTPEKTKAWEQGANGEPLEIKIITISSNAL